MSNITVYKSVKIFVKTPSSCWENAIYIGGYFLPHSVHRLLIFHSFLYKQLNWSKTWTSFVQIYVIGCISVLLCLGVTVHYEEEQT